MLISPFNFAEAPKSYSNIQKIIPEGSRLNAFINSVSLEDTFKDNVAKDGAQYIKVEFEIAAGEAAGFKVVAKFKVMNPDQEATKTAWRRLGTLDQNCTGQLAKRWAANSQMEINDACLKSAFEIGTEVQVVVAIWETGGKMGNHVAGIAPKGEDHLSGALFDKPATAPKATGAAAAIGAVAQVEDWETDL